MEPPRTRQNEIDKWKVESQLGGNNKSRDKLDGVGQERHGCIGNCLFTPHERPNHGDHFRQNRSSDRDLRGPVDGLWQASAGSGGLWRALLTIFRSAAERTT